MGYAYPHPAVNHRPNIAEMKTGEGKTLVRNAASYLNASPAGRARRHRQRLPGQTQSEWMGRVHHFLGLEVGVILPR